MGLYEQGLAPICGSATSPGVYMRGQKLGCPARLEYPAPLSILEGPEAPGDSSFPPPLLTSGDPTASTGLEEGQGAAPKGGHVQSPPPQISRLCVPLSMFPASAQAGAALSSDLCP